MNNMKIVKVFFSTVLFFLFGFCLNIIIGNLVGFESWIFYMLIQLITMILSGSVIFLVLNWKYLKKNRKEANEKQKKIFYIKWRVCFTVLLMLPAIYYCSIGYRQLNNISLLLGKINDFIFHMEHKTFVMNFRLVSSSLFTVFSILVLILTYMILQILFVNTKRSSKVI